MSKPRAPELSAERVAREIEAELDAVLLKQLREGVQAFGNDGRPLREKGKPVMKESPPAVLECARKRAIQLRRQGIGVLSPDEELRMRAALRLGGKWPAAAAEAGEPGTEDKPGSADEPDACEEGGDDGDGEEATDREA